MTSFFITKMLFTLVFVYSYLADICINIVPQCAYGRKKFTFSSGVYCGTLYTSTLDFKIHDSRRSSLEHIVLCECILNFNDSSCDR
jgi:hypothetical protein